MTWKKDIFEVDSMVDSRWIVDFLYIVSMGYKRKISQHTGLISKY